MTELVEESLQLTHIYIYMHVATFMIRIINKSQARSDIKSCLKRDWVTCSLPRWHPFHPGRSILATSASGHGFFTSLQTTPDNIIDCDDFYETLPIFLVLN